MESTFYTNRYFIYQYLSLPPTRQDLMYGLFNSEGFREVEGRARVSARALLDLSGLCACSQLKQDQNGLMLCCANNVVRSPEGGPAEARGHSVTNLILFLDASSSTIRYFIYSFICFRFFLGGGSSSWHNYERRIHKRRSIMNSCANVGRPARTY